VLVRTDDEIYRVDSVWLGPPRATFPWRVRYIGYGIGLLVMVVVMFVQRRVGIELDFFSVAWALVITVVVTRFVGKRIDYERPLGQVLEMFRHEVIGPRKRTAAMRGEIRTRHVRVGPVVRPRAPRKRAADRRAPTTITNTSTNVSTTISKSTSKAGRRADARRRKGRSRVTT
jgi:hypothetical protein